MSQTNIFASGALPVELSRVAESQVNQWSFKKYAALLLANLAAVNYGGDVASNISVTLSLDTSIYAAGDVLADTQAIAGAVRVAGGSSLLQSVSLLDKDDNAAAGIDLVFLNANLSLGAENAPPDISDTNAAAILGIVSLASGDFIDVTGAKVATKANIGLQLTPATGTTIYVAAIARGTPTQTAAGIIINFGFGQE